MTRSSHRGGTAVLIRCALAKLITKVDTSNEDQVWAEFSFAPRTLFGFCYIPPSDSPHYSHVSFATIQEKINTTELIKSYCVIGDLNTRFGSYVRDLPDLTELPTTDSYSYPSIPDPVPRPNDNAYVLSSICTEVGLLILNNLQTNTKHFISDKTFRKGREWVSELDTCVVGPNILKNVCDFRVIRNDSLPSDHAPITLSLSLSGVDMHQLSLRAEQLGDHAVLYGQASKNTNLAMKPINMQNINVDSFLRNLSNENLPDANLSIDNCVTQMTDILYNCATRSRCVNNNNYDNDVNQDRWERIVNDRDDTRVWKAVDWRGEFVSKNEVIDKPSDQEFKEFFESNLNLHSDITLTDITSDVTIPVLDDPINIFEVEHETKNMNSNKACGLDGVSPGIFGVLPGPWLLFLTAIFNNVFSSGYYPISWTRAKMFTIFKKGNKMLPKNYRGISITNSISKLYDMILSSRLTTWFKPYREQAGAQEKRGCIEHIVCLRLLCDLAKRKKFKLFVTFVDFTQAYDRVPRHVLFRVLRRLGCGAVMLAALIAMYSLTESVIGSVVVSVSLGVRQGSPTSCLLFIIFMNDLIMMIKGGVDVDGFLSWLHILVLMDDTVLLATTRHNMIKKIEILQNYCEEYGMKVNEIKTKFFVLNGGVGDGDTIRVGELVVERCHQYIYLGSPFTADCSVSSAVKAHAMVKMPHVLKYVNFIKKNNDIPFYVKRRIFDAALMSSLIYGCESWFSADLKPMIKLYNWCIKELLGVRKNICNDMCYVEGNFPSFPCLIKYRQHKFMKKIWVERSALNDDPLVYTINKVLEYNTVTSRTIRDYIDGDVISLERGRQDLITNLANSTSSRRIIYKSINPSFAVHSVYGTKHTIHT